jgi:hypothetical protein
MEIQDVKDFLTARNGVEPIIEFNQNCMKRLEINFENGEIGLSHHIEYDHVMVYEGQGEPYKMKITNHREAISKEVLEERFGIKG